MKEEIYEEIIKNPELQGKIMSVTGKSHATIMRWARKKDSRLNDVKVLKILKEHLNYNTYEDILC